MAKTKTLTKKKVTKASRKVEAEIVDDHTEETGSPTELSTEKLAVEKLAIDRSFQNDSSLEDELAPIEVSSTLPAIKTSREITSSDPIAAYLRELRKYPLLTKEQEMELAKKFYETKDPAAAQALVTANLRFVVKVAVEYSKFGARLIDLVQEGNMGLMHAVREFNPYKGARLITYAVWWIRGYIQEYLMKQYSLVKIGTTQNQKKLFYRLQKEKNALDSLGESPDMALIGEKLGIPKEEVEEMNQRIRGRDVSLSQPTDAENGSSLMDFQKNGDLSPDELISSMEELEILKEKIEELRPSLNEKEKILLEERLLSDSPMTLQEIGQKYGITREAVRQTEARLMKKIKSKMSPSIVDSTEQDSE